MKHLKELADLKFTFTEKAVELQAKAYQREHTILENKIDALQKIVYVGLGVVAAFQVALRVFVK